MMPPSLLARLPGLEENETLLEYDLSLAAGWASDGPAWLVFGCVALAAAAALFYVVFQRREHPAVRTVAAVCRAAAFCLLLLMLAQPQLDVTVSKPRRPVVALLFDGTESMATADRFVDDDYRAQLEAVAGPSVDVNGPSGSDTEPPRRIDYVRRLLRKTDGNLLARLHEAVRLEAYAFDSAGAIRPLRLAEEGNSQPDGALLAEQLTADGKLSAQGTALENLARRHTAGNLAGVVLWSDFNRNAGAKPLDAAKRLGTSLFTVGIGAAKAIDLAAELHVPPVMKKDERTTLTAMLRQDRLDGRSAQLTLTARRLSGPGRITNEWLTVGRKTVRLDGHVCGEEFSFVPEQTGRWVFELVAEPLAEEAGHDNNRTLRESTVRDDFLRLMFVEYEPTWEWRFIKEVFHRDKLVGMEGFRTFLRSSDVRVRETEAMFLHSMSPPRSEFFANDVIFLGDMPAGAVSRRFCRMAEEFVHDFGGGLVVLCGPRFGPAELVGTELEQMLPVEFDPASQLTSEQRLNDTEPFRLQLTPWAAQYDFMQLGSTDEENAMAWGNLGPLPWYQQADRLHPGAIVLAEHPVDTCRRAGADDAAPAAARQPLIAVRGYGKGEVVYLAFNETWRLRRKYGERYYRQFWGQMIHRLGLRHALGNEKRFVVQTDATAYRTGDQVLLTVEAYDEDYQALTEEKLTEIRQARAEEPDPILHGELLVPDPQAPDGHRTRPLRIAQVRAGVFETRLPVFAEGRHTIRVVDPVTADPITADPITAEPVERSFTVRAVGALERRDVKRDLGLQEQLAAANPGGRSFDFTEVDQLPERITSLPKTQTRQKVVPLWQTWYLFAAVIGLLLAEWSLRKWVNLR